MSLSSYTDLQTAITSWLGGRTDLTTYYPDWITLFETAAARKLRVRPMEKTSILTVGKDTRALLHFDGNFTDSAVSTTTWTAVGNATTDTTKYKFGGSSGLFDGSGDYVGTSDNVNFTLGSNDFTIELWFNTTTTISFQCLAGQDNGTPANSSWSILYSPGGGGQVYFQCYQSSATVAVTSTSEFSSTLNLGWHHLAITRAGTILRLFVDGIQEGGNTTLSGAINDSAEDIRIGDNNAAPSWNGWIDEFRMSIGVARWTSNFTPRESAYSNDGSASLPADYLSTRRLTWLGDPSIDLNYLQPSTYQTYLPINQTTAVTSARPQSFTIEGGRLITPAQTGTQVELVYYAKNAAVSGVLNWLFTNYPDIYLFGALAEGAAFVRDDVAIAGWIQRRDIIFDEIKMVDFRDRPSSMATRVMSYTP